MKAQSFNRPVHYIAASSLLLLSACSTTTEYVSKPVFPPDQLMKDCPQAEAPPAEQRTYGGLVEYVLEQKKALEECNADKAALRQWKKEIQAKAEKP